MLSANPGRNRWATTGAERDESSGMKLQSLRRHAVRIGNIITTRHTHIIAQHLIGYFSLGWVMWITSYLKLCTGGDRIWGGTDKKKKIPHECSLNCDIEHVPSMDVYFLFVFCVFPRRPSSGNESRIVCRYIILTEIIELHRADHAETLTAVFGSEVGRTLSHSSTNWLLLGGRKTDGDLQ